MVRRTCTKMRFAELRYVELASLQRPVSGGNRRLQDEEVASASSTSQSCGSSIRGSSILSALQLLGLSIAAPSGQTIPTILHYAHHPKGTLLL